MRYDVGRYEIICVTMPILTVETLCLEAAEFSAIESQHLEPLLYGVTDGKAIGTYNMYRAKV